MALYRFLGDGKAVANDLIRIPFSDKVQDLDLSVCQIVDFETLCQAVGNLWRYIYTVILDVLPFSCEQVQ